MLRIQDKDVTSEAPWFAFLLVMAWSRPAMPRMVDGAFEDLNLFHDCASGQDRYVCARAM